MADYIWVYLQSNLLAVIALVLTLILSYHYIIERGSGVKLSKKYRNSIHQSMTSFHLPSSPNLSSKKIEYICNQLKLFLKYNEKKI